MHVLSGLTCVPVKIILFLLSPKGSMSKLGSLVEEDPNVMLRYSRMVELIVML